MTKPTLVQSLLGRPSQTYSFPQDKHYYSSKAQLLRLAEGGGLGGPDRYSKEHHDEEKRKRKRSAGHSQSMNVMRTEVTHKSNNDNITNLNASPSVTPPQQPSVVVLNDTTSDEEEEDEHDIFYTPNSSPNASMASSVVTAVLPLPANAKASRPVKTEIAIAVPSTRTPASRSTTSLSSTVATSLDGHSLFSAESNAMSESTRITTPFTSVSGHEPPRRMMRSKTSRAKRSYTYTDEDWAKDVRWLVTPQGDSARSTKTPLPRTKPNNLNISRSERSTPPSPPRNHSISHAAKVTPSIMMSMTALLEEDEDRDGRLSRLVQMPENPRSSVLISHPRRGRAGPRMRRSESTGSSPYRESPLRTSHQRHASVDGQLEPATSSSGLPEPISTSHMSSIPSHGTPGFTSLTLPRAPPPPFASGSGSGNRTSMFGAIGAGDGKVDLTKSGIAQTTMASVEVVRGLSGTNGFKGILGRKESVASRGRGKQRSTDAALGFTSYRAPPTYVPSGSVLVQVWSVGIDAIDARLVGSEDGIKASKSSSSMSRSGSMTGQERPSLMRSVSLRARLTRTPSHQRGRSEDGVDDRWRGSESSVGVGFVPGRSFVGRVLESGWEVKEEVAKKGDWVIGLLDVRKCGALQEFVIVDRHRIYKVPHPRMKHPTSLGDDDRSFGDSVPRSSFAPDSRDSLSSRSVVSGQSLGSVSHEAGYLSPSELALLPLCGVAAYRAVRTFVAAFSSATLTPSATAQGPLEKLDVTPRSPNVHENGPRRRALVLRGHDGIGAIAVQMLVRKGWRVSVHASMPSFSDPEEEADYMKQVEDRVRSWGGEEVVFDDGDVGSLGEEGRRGAVVRVIERLVADGDAFDAVLDTVGSKAIWEVSERLLSGVGSVQNSPAKKGAFGSMRKRSPRSKGQFTTLVGDVPERTIPSAGDHFKAGIRSLKNSHKDEGRNSGKVGYAWVSVAQDVDWDGDDIRESIGAVLRLALKEGIRPRVGGDERIVSFENTPSVFVEGGPLEDGGTIVVKVVD